MSHITAELLNEKNLSMWLASIAVLAFAAGYSLASLRHAGEDQQFSALKTQWTLPMGKYGHLEQRP